MIATRDSGSLSVLQQAIDQAKTAGADEATLKSATARVDELQSWTTVKSYVSKSFNRVLAEANETNLSEMVKLAEAAGLTNLVKQGSTKLAQIAIVKKKAAAFVKDGNASFNQKKYVNAIKSYDQALELQPADAITLLNRSHANRLTGKFLVAAEDAARSLEMRPHNADAHRAGALALFRLQRLDEAMEECEKGLLVNPTDSRLVTTKRDIHLAMERKARASQTAHWAAPAPEVQIDCEDVVPGSQDAKDAGFEELPTWSEGATTTVDRAVGGDEDPSNIQSLGEVQPMAYSRYSQETDGVCIRI
jgi:tetratricopeptide (TPR) repeat protein